MATPATSAPTSSRSAACSTRCSPDARRSRAPTSSTVIAAIMSSEPPPIAALAAAHPLLDHVLRRCLEKDPERRWQSIGDVTGELRWIARASRRATRPGAPPAATRRPAARSWRRSRCGARARRAWRSAALRSRPQPRQPSVAAPRDLHAADRRSVDGAVARRHADRLRRQPRSRADALGALARRHREPGAAGHRRRQLSVLVAGWPHARLLRRRQAEANRCRRRHAAGDHRRAERPRRHVERRRRDPVRVGGVTVRSCACPRAAVPRSP